MPEEQKLSVKIVRKHPAYGHVVGSTVEFPRGIAQDLAAQGYAELPADESAEVPGGEVSTPPAGEQR